MNRNDGTKDIWDELLASWPSPIIARAQLSRWSGGLLNPATVRNLDSLGKGPHRIKIGRRVVYPVRDLVSWLRTRCR